MLKRGKTRNCEKCGANYGQYDNNPNSDWSEYWIGLSNPSDETKGLCQFCNHQSRYYIDRTKPYQRTNV